MQLMILLHCYFVHISYEVYMFIICTCSVFFFWEKISNLRTTEFWNSAEYPKEEKREKREEKGKREKIEEKRQKTKNKENEKS